MSYPDSTWETWTLVHRSADDWDEITEVASGITFDGRRTV